MSGRFDYVKYDNASVVSQEEIKDLARKLEHSIENLYGEDDVTEKEFLATLRAKNKALDALEECYMWCGKAIRDGQIARNGSAEPQEERTNS